MLAKIKFLKLKYIYICSHTDSDILIKVNILKIITVKKKIKKKVKVKALIPDSKHFLIYTWIIKRCYKSCEESAEYKTPEMNIVYCNKETVQWS